MGFDKKEVLSKLTLQEVMKVNMRTFYVNAALESYCV